jgi:CubicO group peptidase (beta-lactamase class C family)
VDSTADALRSDSSPLASLAGDLDPLAAADLADLGHDTALVLGVAMGDETRAFGYGERRVGSGVAPDGDTYFDIASVSKVFAGTLLGLEVTRGRAKLEDTVAQYMPELAGTPAGAISLEQLATHTSGLPIGDPTATGPIENPSAGYDTAHLVAYLSAWRPDAPGPFPVGYSNTGVGLLGYILSEKIAGVGFAEYLGANLLEPLGMRRTKLALTATDLANAAQGYDGVLDPMPYVDIGVLAAAGQIKSTANDLLTFLRFQMAEPSDGLCTRDARMAALCAGKDLAQTPRHDQPGGSIGLLFNVGSYGANREHTMIYKPGADQGFTAYVTFDRARKLGVVQLSNTNVRPQMTWTKPIFGFDVPFTTYPSFDLDSVASYGGSYVAGDTTIEVGPYHGRFAARATGSLPIGLWASAPASNGNPPTAFVVRDDDRYWTVTFTGPEHGAPTALVIKQPGEPDITFARRP